MTKQRTLSIIKPEAVAANNIGAIIQKFENSGLQIIASKMVHLSKDQAEEFYAVHKERPFYNDLVNYMISGPVLVMVLEGDDAVKTNRDIMGATNPKDALKGTIRAEFANSIEENAVHGSDSGENAQTEINLFFKPEDICPRTR